MIRTLPVCAVLLVLASAGQAAPPAAPAETVIRMTVQPMAAPRPALKYQLLPELREMNPGNPVLGYLRCFMEQRYFFFEKKSEENREKWQEMPLKELPVKELRGYGGWALRQADYAARLETPDWQVLLKARSEGYHLLIPDVQQLRLLASALVVRFRGEVADHRFDDALVTAKTLFALSRHLGEHPTLIADLVGLAIASFTIPPLEEMIQQPGCPNLYWALTDLPSPFIDLRKGLQGERMLLAAEATVLDESAPMTDAQLRKAMNRLREVVPGSRSAPEKDLAKWFYSLVNDETHVRAARKRLVEAGLDTEKVKRFPAVQVVLLDEKHSFEARRDDVMKAMALPYWQAEAALSSASSGKKGPEESLFADMLPSPKVKMAQARLDQRIALLRCVEALRLYAAGHEGRLPAHLADVEVPLPLDPVNGKPFAYEVKGRTAVVRGSAPRGMEKNAAYNVRYEVTIRK